MWKWIQASLGLFTQLGGNPLKLLVLSSSFQYELQRSIFCVSVLNLAIVCITLLKALIDISKKLKLPVALVEIGINKAGIFTTEQHAILKITTILYNNKDEFHNIILGGRSQTPVYICFTCVLFHP